MPSFFAAISLFFTYMQLAGLSPTKITASPGTLLPCDLSNSISLAVFFRTSSATSRPFKIKGLEFTFAIIKMITYLPKPLTENSTIGLICPAGGLDSYKSVKPAVDYLKKSGYKVKLGRSIVVSNQAYKYLSGCDND